MKLDDLVDFSEKVRHATARNKKTALLAAAIRAAGPHDVGIAVAYLSGKVPQGRLGIGPAALRKAGPSDSDKRASLTLRDVDDVLTRLADTKGPGSADAKLRVLHGLLAAATRPEQAFLRALLFGDLRQGANEGLVVDAVAKAAEVPAATVRRAAMLSGDLSTVAEAAFKGGAPLLAAFGLQLFRPIEPMLASPAESPDHALGRMENALVEFKMDGARVQVHKSGSDVRVFSRRLKDVTASVPELAKAIGGLPIREVVLDGETLALREDGRPHPFQVTMRRFGRKLDVAAMRASLPLSSFFFDCLFLDGTSLIDLGTRDRLDSMDTVVSAALRMPRTEATDASQVERFLRRARDAGHEGVMVKDPTSAYAAGRRGKSWLKLKPVHTLDLVVLAAEWGHGRRTGWLSNLHLGARDPETGGFVMLGKTFKGLTDSLLAWQTEALQAIEVERDRHTVYVEPKLVVEIAFNEIQESPRYPGGLALRFARVKSYRSDKSATDADTIETVRAIHAAGP